jgi:hypothetical protein
MAHPIELLVTAVKYQLQNEAQRVAYIRKVE